MKKKIINREVFAALALGLAPFAAFTDAHASEIDQSTKVTFKQSVQIPGQLLPAGTYWFVVPGPGVIEVFNSDRSTLRATLLDQSAQLPKPPEQSIFKLENFGSTQPGAVRTWFYPGMMIGHEFVYSKKEREEMAMAKQHAVVAVPGD